MAYGSLNKAMLLCRSIVWNKVIFLTAPAFQQSWKGTTLPGKTPTKGKTEGVWKSQPIHRIPRQPQSGTFRKSPARLPTPFTEQRQLNTGRYLHVARVRLSSLRIRLPLAVHSATTARRRRWQAQCHTLPKPARPGSTKRHGRAHPRARAMAGGPARRTLPRRGECRAQAQLCLRRWDETGLRGAAAGGGAAGCGRAPSRCKHRSGDCAAGAAEGAAGPFLPVLPLRAASGEEPAAATGAGCRSRCRPACRMPPHGSAAAAAHGRPAAPRPSPSPSLIRSLARTPAFALELVVFGSCCWEVRGRTGLIRVRWGPLMLSPLSAPAARCTAQTGETRSSGCTPAWNTNSFSSHTKTKVWIQCLASTQTKYLCRSID